MNRPFNLVEDNKCVSDAFVAKSHVPPSLLFTSFIYECKVIMKHSTLNGFWSLTSMCGLELCVYV